MTAIHLQHALSHDYLLAVLPCSHTALYLPKEKEKGRVLAKIVFDNFKWSE